MHSLATKVVKDIGFTDDNCKECKKVLKEHIEILVVNVCAVAKVIMILYNAKKLTSEHITAMHTYITERCGGMTGGTSMASDYYGYSHPAYDTNKGGSDLLSVNFATGVARQEISGGGSYSKEITQIVAEHSIKFSNAAVEKSFMDIIQSKIQCLVNDMKNRYNKRKDRLTSAELKKIFETDKQYFVFN